jgi:putative ATP-binding cassette transporter
MDEVMDSMDGDALKLTGNVLTKQLKDSAVIHVGRPSADDAIFKRVLHLVKDPSKRRLPLGEEARHRANPPLGVR